MSYNKDNMKFHIIDTDPVKNTVTLRPTFGTLIKINIAAAAVVWMAVRITEFVLEDRSYAKPEPQPKDPIEN